MENSEQMPRPCRRVGTFTFGLVLVVSGLAMLVSMFFPDLKFTWLLQLSPLALISLGVETLLAARGGALVLFAAAWCLVHDPDAIHF